MIKTENFEIKGVAFVRTFSDLDFMIKKSGTDELYETAEDIAPAPLYEETDIPIEDDEDETDIPFGEESETK